MRNITTEAMDLFKGEAVGLRALLLLKTPDGNYGLWDDVEPLSFNGNTYNPAIGAFSIDSATSGSALSIQTIQISFSDIDNATSQLVENFNWYRKEIIIHLAIIDPHTGLIVQYLHYFTGIIENIIEESNDDLTSKFVLNISSTNWEIGDVGLRVRTDIDQREIDNTDTFFSFTTSAISESPDWGKDGISHPTLNTSNNITGFNL